MTNARAETVSQTSAYREGYARRRCLVPATHYFEWALRSGNANGKKTMFRFTARGQEVFAFPGIWSRSRCGADGMVDSFALLTSAPGPDQAPYHDRQPVILAPDQWADWLNTAKDLAPTFRGSPAGTIAAEYFSGPRPSSRDEPVQPTLF
jgi:putative SOS response-associated peptidase YedK